ncbi:L-aspartate oxidase [Leifsonia sp. AG29]|uniref:L-aspartate oxidase n=1 Tax=Leifsonia sp. AG29 TaxID=2598860 RepID=UPI00131E6163|nr:L-aspartate oxidase [Leifsonia sp. AG29]
MARVVVVGSGVAGTTAALRASARHEVTLVTKTDPAEGSTRYAQGGIAAAVFEDDSVEAHIADTLRAGAGLNVAEAVRVLCTDGPVAVRELIELGARFDTDGGHLARGLEAAHSASRILHAGGDATGAELERALLSAVRDADVTVLDHAFLVDVVVRDGAAAGVSLRFADGGTVTLDADAVILATGGWGRLYRHTTNPAVATADGVAAAWRAGAVVADAEFTQFHPTALAVPGSFLISEAVRGEGAVLRAADGHRFMTDLHPDAELAPRDVVARGIAVEMAAQGGRPVVLDATALGAEFLSRRFPTIDAATRAAGFDWSRQPIPVTPAAHYAMGGVATDTSGRTTLPGLFAVGETACTGAHGANRLASNSLLEGLVFARRAVDAIGGGWPEPPAWVREGRQVRVPLDGAPAVAGTRPTPVDRAALQRLMWDAAGVHRHRDGLQQAAAELAGLSAAGGTEDANLLSTARLVVAAALSRDESRGAHFRSDAPMTGDGVPVHTVLVPTRASTVPAPLTSREPTEVTLPC